MFSHPPLKTLKIRTAGLASAKSAMFGMVRCNKDGTPRAHQGVDFASDAGYRVYAVEDGFVVDTSVIGAYGQTITILHMIDGKRVYSFYAHLGELKVGFSKTVKAGDIIALTSDSGNAKGMTTIKKGGHLHFGVRTTREVKRGLDGWLDPLPLLKQFIENARKTPPFRAG